MIQEIVVFLLHVFFVEILLILFAIVHFFVSELLFLPGLVVAEGVAAVKKTITLTK
jgi:hypothetical protein